MPIGVQIGCWFTHVEGMAELAAIDTADPIQIPPLAA
jgi:hypothetical protein